MQVAEVNDIKTYNLSHGKTIPEWLSDRKKRILLKKDVDLRRRIQLIQHFEMPTLSNTVNVSNDGQFIVACGLYKPKVRCYDVNQLGLKFERCLDSEVIKCLILSDDYSKLLFLEQDRWVELHSQAGFYYKTRIPKFGHDMAYNYVSCDALFVGSAPQIYRLNLEVGAFLTPFETNSECLNAVTLNPVHNLLVVGSQQGFIEAWDPRSRERVATLNISSQSLRKLGAVSSLKFRDSLSLAVGTSNGQILMYDIRGDKPILSKDHMYGLPIKDIVFLDGPLDLVASLDCKIVKFWNRNTGSSFTAIQSESDLNMLAAYPHSGMMFVANESPKIMTYYLPSIGPAPKWCSFLDRITEELEESDENVIYDDYKFVTKQQLEEIGLVDLLGTSLLRAYMHGFFIDQRLYRKALEASQPFAYEEYCKQKIRDKIDSQYTDRVLIEDKLPTVNRSLAYKLLSQQIIEQQKNQLNKSKKFKPNPLEDERFSAMFSNPDFEIDQTSEEYRLLNPVMSKLSLTSVDNTQEDEPSILDQHDDQVETTELTDDSTSEEDCEEQTTTSKASLIDEKSQRACLKKKNFAVRYEQRQLAKDGIEKLTFEQRLGRLKKDLTDDTNEDITGNRMMTFHSVEKNDRFKTEAKQKNIQHLKERKRLVRKTTGLGFNKNIFK